MKKFSRQYSSLDQACLEFDKIIRTLSGKNNSSERDYPAENISHPYLSDKQKKHSAALMRINHAGEVCAQALYHAQAISSHDKKLKEKMQQAALEENDHLAWCNQRLIELNSHTSYLNPFWYAGSFAIGLAAGCAGDKWSLGFVAETEQQVVKHLEKHLNHLPKNDERSFHILQQMKKDEAAHRDHAIQSGAAVLPNFIKKIMKITSAVMVKISYWV